MQQYSQDYTKVAQAQNALFFALEDIRNGHNYEAKRDIMQARQLLDEYLAKDNMVPDDDTEDGWVRFNDAMNEIEASRGRVGEGAPRYAPPMGSTEGAESSRVERYGQIDRRFLEQLTQIEFKEIVRRYLSK